MFIMYSLLLFPFAVNKLLSVCVSTGECLKLACFSSNSLPVFSGAGFGDSVLPFRHERMVGER